LSSAGDAGQRGALPASPLLRSFRGAHMPLPGGRGLSGPRRDPPRPSGLGGARHRQRLSCRRSGPSGPRAALQGRSDRPAAGAPRTARLCNPPAPCVIEGHRAVVRTRQRVTGQLTWVPTCRRSALTTSGRCAAPEPPKVAVPPLEPGQAMGASVPRSSARSPTGPRP